MLSKEDNCVIIHFGSKNISVGYVKGEFTLLNVCDKSTIPAVLCYSNGSYYLGDDGTPEPNVDYMKYPQILLGLSYEDYSKSTLANFFFGSPIVSGRNSSVCYKLKNRTISCEGVVTELIKCICKLAAQYVINLRFVYMTISSGVSFSLRNILKSCIENAGYLCAGFLNKAVSAPLYSIYTSYKDSCDSARNNSYFVFSMGYHSCEASLVVVESGVITRYPIFQRTDLGGYTFDQLICNRCKEKAEKDDFDILNTSEVMNDELNLLNNVECNKVNEDYVFEFDGVIIDLSDEVPHPLFDSTLQDIKQSIINGFNKERQRLRKHFIHRSSVKHILFLGGGSQLKPLQDMVISLFKADSEYIEVDSWLSGCMMHILCAEEEKVVDIVDSINVSIGIGMDNGRVIRVIPAGSHLPFKTNLPFECRSEDGRLVTAVYSGDMFIMAPLIEDVHLEFEIDKALNIPRGCVYNLEMQLMKDGKFTLSVMAESGFKLWSCSHYLSIYLFVCLKP